MLPKAELHNHLEGTTTPTLALQLAKRNKVSIAEKRIAPDHTHYLFSDFLDFIHTFDNIIAAIIKHPIDYYDLTFDYLKRNALQGAIYIETMYAPELAEKSSGIPSVEHLKAIQKAIDDAEAAYGIVGRIIMTGLRHSGTDACIRVAKEAAQRSVPAIVGFGLGGDEIHYPIEDFVRPYEIAAEAGLGCTTHAGEFADASTMITAMKQLPLQRIGHGIAAIHCPDTLAMLKDKNITLEICPSSNVVLGLVNTLSEHPLPKLMDAGIRVCLNSDDPPFFNTALAHEYERVQQTFHFSDEIMLKFTQTAIEAAFVDEETKARLKQKLVIKN